MTARTARLHASAPVNETRNAFIVSVLIHAGFLFILLFGILLESFQRRPKEHVFELVSPPSADAMQASAPNPSLPQPAPEQPIDLPELQPIRETQPRPPIEIEQPQPRPVSRPEPTPAPQPREEPRRQMSAEEFRRQFGEPTRSQEVTRPRLEVPEIDTSRLRESLENLVVGTSRTSVQAMTRASQDALGAYVSLIRSRIDAVWIKPSGYRGNHQEVVVLFDVSPNGTISRVRLESGNPRDPFVQSVLNAFNRVRPVGPTPTGQSYTFRMPFRMLDPGG